VGANVVETTITEDGSHVAYTTSHGELGVWEAAAAPPRVLARDLGGFPKLAALADRRVVTAADDVRLWDIEEGRLLRRLGGHPGAWHVEVVGPGLVLTASHDWTVSLWDLDAGAELAMLALDGEAQIATLGPHADLFVCADDAGDVYAFRLVMGGRK
jgi:WD40 repeat protein